MIRHGRILIGMCLAMATVALAQSPDRVLFTLTKLPRTVTTGRTFDAQLLAKIDDGWHIYGLTKVPGPIPTQITLPTDQPFSLSGEIVTSAPKIDYDSVFGSDVEFFEGDAEFGLPIKVDPKAVAGKRTVAVSVRYQICSATTCLPPKVVQVRAPVHVIASNRKK